ncbi:MAG TPA: gluconate 2-dehydrogenase subunit 3 family protein, partial [Candidatus Acidoferrales bacterium]|nr:gluconate 2-dehydrogenase subunit 3 family protein [Candidatus Acidoferrales bacterium]
PRRKVLPVKSTKQNSDTISLKILTPTEARTLEAIADRIFPATETPGAVEAGALDYIDRALAGDYKPLRTLYRNGLRAVDKHAWEKFGRKFTELDGVEKDNVLSDFQSGQTQILKNAADFFETVRCHILEGVFCEPHYGGNKDLIGWRLVGFPGQQYGYREAYINKPVDLEPVATVEPPAENK